MAYKHLKKPTILSKMPIQQKRNMNEAYLS